MTERRQSAPACLRVPAPNARRPEERRPRPGGRVRRPRRGSRGSGRDAGTRGRRPEACSAPPRTALPPWSTSFRDSVRHFPGLATHSVTPGFPAPLSPRGSVGSSLGFWPLDLRLRGSAPLRSVAASSRAPAPEVSGRSFIPSKYFTIRAEDTAADPGVLPLASASDGEGAQNEMNRSVEF